MWQDEMEASNNSSGLYLLASPLKAGSLEAAIMGLPEILIE